MMNSNNKHIALGAIDKVTGLYVFPNNANKKDKYMCVECERDVVLKQGKIKRHHFAHKHDITVIPCNNYNSPSETQIHKDAKLRLKSLFDQKYEITFVRTCVNCSIKEKYEIPPIDSNSSIQLEYAFEYNCSRKVADVAYIDNIDGLIGIFEICHTHATDVCDRPEPWFELDAIALIEQTSEYIEGKSIEIPCVRVEKCEKCVKIYATEKEEYEKKCARKKQELNEQIGALALQQNNVVTELQRHEAIKTLYKWLMLSDKGGIEPICYCRDDDEVGITCVENVRICLNCDQQCYCIENIACDCICNGIEFLIEDPISLTTYNNKCKCDKKYIKYEWVHPISSNDNGSFDIIIDRKQYGYIFINVVNNIPSQHSNEFINDMSEYTFEKRESNSNIYGIYDINANWILSQKCAPEKLNVIRHQMTYAPMYIDVPFKHKDFAKRMGAIWDSFFKCWKYPGGNYTYERIVLLHLYTFGHEVAMKYYNKQTTVPLILTPTKQQEKQTTYIFGHGVTMKYFNKRTTVPLIPTPNKQQDKQTTVPLIPTPNKQQDKQTTVPLIPTPNKHIPALRF